MIKFRGINIFMISKNSSSFSRLKFLYLFLVIVFVSIFYSSHIVFASYIKLSCDHFDASKTACYFYNDEHSISYSDSDGFCNPYPSTSCTQFHSGSSGISNAFSYPVNGNVYKWNRFTVGSDYYYVDRTDFEHEFINSDITTDTTWYSSTVYIISGNIEIDPGVTLTIQPGTTVRFDDTTSSSLTVDGTLDAEGSLGNVISFFSNSATPAAGDWGGITVGSGGEANFDHIIISSAGKTGTSEAEIYNNGGTVSITHSVIIKGANYGIKNSSGTTTIDDNTDIGFNVYGIYKDGGTVTVSNSIIHDNSSYGIYNNTVSSIDAEDNYWGDTNGPSDYGPGSGDAVSDYVDFDPWTLHLYYPNSNGDSVDNSEIRYDSSTQYSDELNAAVSTWNDLSNIYIAPKITTTDLTISDVNHSDVSWAGLTHPEYNPGTIQLNTFYLGVFATNSDTDSIQNVITHELGHALGLDHSYSGNIMYFLVNPQTSLGPQDRFDYYYLWP